MNIIWVLKKKVVMCHLKVYLLSIEFLILSIKIIELYSLILYMIRVRHLLVSSWIGFLLIFSELMLEYFNSILSYLMDFIVCSTFIDSLTLLFKDLDV